MSYDKIADSQKKLEMATSIVVAYINTLKPSEKSPEKSSEKTSKSSSANNISEDEVLAMLEKTFNKMNQLVPYKDKKVGLGH